MGTHPGTWSACLGPAAPAVSRIMFVHYYLLPVLMLPFESAMREGSLRWIQYPACLVVVVGQT